MSQKVASFLELVIFIKHMIRLGQLLNESVQGKTLISVDIQPEYEPYFKFKIEDYTEFLNENYPIVNNMVFLYNGHETLGMVHEADYKMWWLENGLDEDILNYSQFYDKGYNFFAYCMDSFIDEPIIVNFVRFMYENGVNDSRNMDREMWKKYLKQHRKTDKTELYNLLKVNDDMIHIPDLMDYIKRYNNIILTGGGINQCLKEVEIALKALNKPYDVLQKFTY